MCGFSFSFVALGSAFTASARNGFGLYTLAKGVSVCQWLVRALQEASTIPCSPPLRVLLRSMFASMRACIHPSYLLSNLLSFPTHVPSLARGVPVVTAPGSYFNFLDCATRVFHLSPKIEPLTLRSVTGSRQLLRGHSPS